MQHYRITNQNTFKESEIMHYRAMMHNPAKYVKRLGILI